MSGHGAETKGGGKERTNILSIREKDYVWYCQAESVGSNYPVDYSIPVSHHSGLIALATFLLLLKKHQKQSILVRKIFTDHRPLLREIRAGASS